jgi:molecular chaperone DnaK
MAVPPRLPRTPGPAKATASRAMNPLPNIRPPDCAPRPKLKAFRVLGIDLGTTNSAIAELRWSPARPDQVDMAACLEIPQPTLSGDFTSVLVPSVVCHLPDRQLIGEGARRCLSRSVELGLRPNASYLAEAKNEMGIGRLYPQAKDGYRSPAEVSGHVLRFLRDGTPGAAARTVVTVPASFQYSQREDTLLAADLAGIPLGHGDLLDEPLAAFLDFIARLGPAALDGIGEETETMIIDFGGGTCDVAIFTLRRRPDGTLGVSPRAVSRYHRLGGADIDRAIVHQVLIPELARQNRIAEEDWEYEIRKEQLEPQLLATAEQLKVGLCELLNHRRAHGADLREALADTVKTYPGTQTLSLSDGTRLKLASPALDGVRFAEIMEPFLDDESLQAHEDEYTLSCSVFAPIADALDRAGLRPSQIGFLLAVGGSSLNPLVIRALQDYFGEFLVHRFDSALDMQVSVARGAAYHALLLHLYGRSLLTPVSSDSLSLQTDRGLHPIIPRGAPLPVAGDFRPTDAHRIVAPGGPIRITFWAGSGVDARPVFTGITRPIPAGMPLTLSFDLDANQHFTFGVTPADGGETFEGRIESPLHNVVNPGKDRETILRIERGIRSGEFPPETIPARLLELALLHGKVGMHDKAVALLKRLIRQQPEYRQSGLCHLANLYGRKGDTYRQEKCYLDAVLAGSAMALLNLANLYARKGRWMEAEEMCRRFEAEEPSAIGMVLLARCLRARAKDAEAEEALDSAFARFGRDLTSLDEISFSWYLAAVAMRDDPALRRLAETEEARRKDAPTKPKPAPEGHLPRLESDPDRPKP